MEIHVLDTVAAMRGILTAPVAERPAMLATVLEPVAPMFRYAPGGDPVAAHTAGGGFPLDRDDERLPAAVERLAEADALGRVRRALHTARDAQLAATPEVARPEVLRVVVVLVDPDDAHVMDVDLGLLAAGGIPGLIWIGLWPDDENLARIEATAVHELHHNLRYSTVPWDPRTVTVGEQVVSEGLADAFARHLHGDLGYTRIGVPPQADLRAQRRLLANLDLAGMQHLAPWVHGDATATRFGAAPVGMPTGIGYALGNRLVDRYLGRTGRDVTEALLVNWSDVVRTATADEGLGLGPDLG